MCQKVGISSRYRLFIATQVFTLLHTNITKFKLSVYADFISKTTKNIGAFHVKEKNFLKFIEDKIIQGLQRCFRTIKLRTTTARITQAQSINCLSLYDIKLKQHRVTISQSYNIKRTNPYFYVVILLPFKPKNVSHSRSGFVINHAFACHSTSILSFIVIQRTIKLLLIH